MELALVAMNLAGMACSSGTALKKTGDAAAPRNLDVADLSARDAAADIGTPDLPGPDVLSPDTSPVPKDTPPADRVAPISDATSDVATIEAPVSDAGAADLASRDEAPISDVWPSELGASDGAGDSSTVIDVSPTGEAGQVVACTGEYTACGCGCCAGTPMRAECYYPSLGESVAAIAAQDQAVKSATNCNLAGCSVGIRYVCCAPAAPEPPSSASYTTDWYIGDIDRLQVSKSGADCATLSFALPMVTRNSGFRVTLPGYWGMVSGSFGACGDAGVSERATNAVGMFALRVSGSVCVADVHVTLFSIAASGEVRSTGLDVDGLVMTEISTSMCH